MSEIHIVAEVPRSAIYETLDRLEHRGIIETSTGRPKKFRAVPPKMAIAKIESEVLSAVKDAREGLEELASAPPKEGTDLRIWAVKGKTRIKERLERMVDSVKSDMIIAGHDDLIMFFEDTWRMAKEHGIKLKFAALDPSKIQALKRYGRIIKPKTPSQMEGHKPIKVLFVRADKKNILLASEYKDDKQIEDLTAFWTDDQSIVGFINYLIAPLTDDV